MADDVILVEFEITSPAGASGVRRYADRSIPPFPPTDALRPNVPFGPRLIEAPSLRRRLFEDPATLSPSLAVGMMTLANADGGLNELQGFVWGKIAAYAWTPGTTFAQARPLIYGVCANPIYDDAASQPARVRAPLYDQRAVLSKPLQPHLYSGLNGFGGVLYEGLPDGLKGRPKPLAFGNLFDAHVAAPQVNPGLNVYQLHDGAMLGSIQVFDRGDGAGYAYDGDLSGAAFDAATPAAAHYVTDYGRGLVKINGSPVGQLTFGLGGQSDGIWGSYAQLPGLVIGQILERAGVSPVDEIWVPSLGFVTGTVGIFDEGGATAEQLIAEVAAAVPCAVLPDEHGIWRAIAFGPPAEVADFTLSPSDIIALQPDGSVSLPAGEVRVGWGKNYKTFSDTEVAPALRGTASAERLAAEYRWAVAEDPAVKARLPDTWRKLEIRTALRLEAEALDLAQRLKALFGLKPDGRPRRGWQVVVPRTDAVLNVQLGKTVALNYPARSIGENFILIGCEVLRPRRDQVTWTLWG